MKEIKFRGKAKMSIQELDEQGFAHENGWVYGNLIQNGNIPYIVGDIVEACDEYIVHEWWMPVHLESVGQFTGLTDKNGKEIYEGDICLCDRNINDRTDKKRFVVDYQDGAFFLDEWAERIYLHDLSETYEFVEVIGNIFEDEHLLED